MAPLCTRTSMWSLSGGMLYAAVPPRLETVASSFLKASSGMTLASPSRADETLVDRECTLELLRDRDRKSLAYGCFGRGAARMRSRESRLELTWSYTGRSPYIMFERDSMRVRCSSLSCCHRSNCRLISECHWCIFSEFVQWKV